MLEFNATFLIAMFSFVVFIFIMNAIFYKPILNIIRKREDYINSNYEDSKRFEGSACELSTQRKAKLEQTQDKCRHDVKISVEKAQTKAAEKVAQVKEDTKLEIQQKKNELKDNEDVLKQEVKDTVVKELASSIVAKLSGSKIKMSD